MTSQFESPDNKVRRTSIWRAFTLIELVVVVAVAALLLATAVPMRLESPAKMRAIMCMYNCKQLALGYLMYAHDNHDIALASAGNTSGIPVWVPGNAAILPDAVDGRLITESPTFYYFQSQKLFRCPADKSAFLHQGRITSRNRSYSLNGFMGPAVNPAIDRNRDILKSMTTVSQMNDLNQITAPGPAAVFVFVDEHENSIDDAQFLPFGDFHRYGNQEWLNCPSGRHDNAAGFAFADGHAELRKWHDSTVTAVQLGPPPKHGAFPRRAGPADFAWWTNHIAVFR
jgi:prepilin-type N-terminal cleavage/methylation domain-containing protein/prepilin-type processing-associated H-X9-DG protein